MLAIFQAMAAVAAAMAGSRLIAAPSNADAGTFATVLASVGIVAGLRVLHAGAAERFALSYIGQLRVAMMGHVLRTPADARGMRNGLVMTRVVNDFSAIKLWLSDGIASGLAGMAIVATLIGFLAVVYPASAIGISTALLVWCVIVLICHGPLRARILSARRNRGRIAIHAGSMLSGRFAFLMHGAHDPTLRRLDRQSRKLANALIGRAMISGVMRSAALLVFPVTAIVVALLGVASREDPDLEVLGVLFLATGLISAQLATLSVAVEYRLASQAATDRVKTIFNLPALRPPAAGQAMKRSFRGRPVLIRTERKSASTDDTQAWEVRLDPGAVATIHDLSPAETSRLFDRIAGLADGSDVLVELGGKRLDQIRNRDRWRTVALLSPRIPLVHGSIERNISLGNPSRITDRERARICRAFGVTPAALSGRITDEACSDPRAATLIRAGAMRLALCRTRACRRPGPSR